MMKCCCERAVTVRPMIGGKMVCISRWIVILIIIIFAVVLLVRCQRSTETMAQTVTVNENVSRETVSDRPFDPQKHFV